MTSDDEIAAILADMVDTQLPEISPIKSQKRQRDVTSEDELIPSSQPPPKRHRPDEGIRTTRNRLTTLETRRAKCKRSLQVLREHASKSTCPYGLQYRPKSHLSFDKQFQDDLDKICHRAHSDLLTLMIQQQEKNLVADNQAIEALQQQLKNLCPDPKRQANIQSALSRAANKTRPRPRSTASTNNSQPDLATMQQKLTELHNMFAVFNEAVTNYNLANPNLKKILMKHWHLIQGQPNIARIFKQPPIVSYRKEKSLKDILVRAKIPSSTQQS